MKNALIWLIERLLNGALSPAQRNRLVIHILDKLSALPLRAIIVSSDEGLLVNGQTVDFEKARALRDSSTRVLESQAFAICLDQVRFLAVQKGLATGLPPEDLLFYRAALWYSDELKAQLAVLAQREPYQQLGDNSNLPV